MVLQAPPDAGSLGPTGVLNAISSHVTILDIGFDVFSEIDDGETVRNMAFASLVTDAPPAPAFNARLYRINLLTGKVELRGKFKSAHVVVDIAIPPDE